jgi:hypothetical protein
MPEDPPFVEISSDSNRTPCSSDDEGGATSDAAAGGAAGAAAGGGLEWQAGTSAAAAAQGAAFAAAAAAAAAGGDADEDGGAAAAAAAAAGGDELQLPKHLPSYSDEACAAILTILQQYGAAGTARTPAAVNEYVGSLFEAFGERYAHMRSAEHAARGALAGQPAAEEVLAWLRQVRALYRELRAAVLQGADLRKLLDRLARLCFSDAEH